MRSRRKTNHRSPPSPVPSCARRASFPPQTICLLAALQLTCESQIRVTINGSFYMTSLKVETPWGMNCTVPGREVV